jgi:hypothetical protein
MALGDVSSRNGRGVVVTVAEPVHAASVSVMAKVAIMATMSLRNASYGSGPGDGQ